MENLRNKHFQPANSNTIHGFLNHATHEKATQYIEKYGHNSKAEQDLEFIYDVICNNVNYANSFTPDLFARCRKVIALLNDLNKSRTPLTGHRVKIIGDSYKSCEAGILSDICQSLNTGRATVCSSGSAHISSLKAVKNIGARLDISGGPFHPIDCDRLTSLDTVNACYWIWGDRPCVNGKIWVYVDVARWLYRAT